MNAKHCRSISSIINAVMTDSCVFVVKIVRVIQGRIRRVIANAPMGFGNKTKLRRRCFGRREVGLALVEAAEKFITFAAAANENVLVLQHRLDDAQNRLRA